MKYYWITYININNINNIQILMKCLWSFMWLILSYMKTYCVKERKKN